MSRSERDRWADWARAPRHGHAVHAQMRAARERPDTKWRCWECQRVVVGTRQCGCGNLARWGDEP